MTEYVNSRTATHAERRALAEAYMQQFSIAPYSFNHAEMLGSIGEDVRIESGFKFDYGTNIHIGDGSFLNFNCVFLDIGEVHIGKKVQIGPGVHIYTVSHPLDHECRAAYEMSVAPVTIEDNCWIGGGTIIMPGVTIGARSVIGAGSVVTKSIPPDTLAFGNPCRVIKQIE
jgi:maltose O-acetyltransferase